jgi:hypothetical protein
LTDTESSQSLSDTVAVKQVIAKVNDMETSDQTKQILRSILLGIFTATPAASGEFLVPEPGIKRATHEVDVQTSRPSSCLTARVETVNELIEDV